MHFPFLWLHVPVVPDRPKPRWRSRRDVYTPMFIADVCTPCGQRLNTEATRASINQWTDKQNVVYLYNGIYSALNRKEIQGAWGAQSTGHPTSAQVTISQLVSPSPASGSVPTARSPEPASDSVSPSLPPLLPCSCSVCLSLSLSKINKH